MLKISYFLESSPIYLQSMYIYWDIENWHNFGFQSNISNYMRCLFPRSDTSYINRAPHLQVSHFIWNSEITKKMTNFWYLIHIGFNLKLPCEDSNGIWSLILFLFFWSCWMLVDVWQRGSSVCLLISRLNLRPKSMGAAKVLDESCTKVTTIKTATSPSSLLCKRCFNQKGEIKLWEYWVRLENETYWPALVSYVVFMPW